MTDIDSSCSAGENVNEGNEIISSGSSNSSGWDEVMTDDPMGDDDDSLLYNASDVGCLFCSQNFKSFEEAIGHCSVDHAFHLCSIKRKLDMDCYSYIKMVNYIRTHNPDPKILMSNISSDGSAWEDVKYLKPVIEDDRWLTFDFDDMDEIECGYSHANDSSKVIKVSSAGGHLVNLENGCVTLSETHFSELQKELHMFRAKIQDKELLLKECNDTINRMRETLKLVVSADTKTIDTDSIPRCVGSVDVNDDDNYFSSYSHFGIHHEMLSDKVRTETYKEAINLCASGKTVMDLGCGTGILSMFAASAGAESVFAIDQSDIVYHAIDIIRENNLDKEINVIKGRLEDTVLPEDNSKFDVIVSEWMGYFLLFEGMLDSVIYARDKHLKPGGLLLPNRCSISLTGYNSLGKHNELIGFWSDVYGYKMTCMKKEVVREALVEIVNSEEQITDCCEVFTIDIMTATVNSVNFTSEFELNVKRDGQLTSIVGHFDVFFDLEKPVHFSTSPSSTPTHWKQTVFFFKQPIEIAQGEVLPGKIICQRDAKDVRSLVVTLIIKGHKQVFLLH